MATWNRETAVSVATMLHKARCQALWRHWTEGAPEPVDADYGYLHGWFQLGEYSIGAHEYAPGPTYNVD